MDRKSRKRRKFEHGVIRALSRLGFHLNYCICEDCVRYGSCGMGSGRLRRCSAFIREGR